MPPFLATFFASRLTSFIAVPAAIGLLVLLVYVKASDAGAISSLRHDRQSLSDAIHGGEPNYPVRKPGYIVQIQQLGDEIRMKDSNIASLRGTIVEQNKAVQALQAQADKNARDYHAEVARNQKQHTALLNLSSQIAALRPSEDSAETARQAIETLVRGLR